MRTLRVILARTWLPLLLACGAALPPVTVRPATVTLGPGETQLFQAMLSGALSKQVNWSVMEGSAGGAISQDGLYTAPFQPGTYHVVATNRAAQNDSGSAAATVMSTSVKASILPKAATLAPHGVQPFSCTVVGTSDTACTFQVQETGGGAVSGSGLYMAPASAGIFHVVASSHDGSHADVATVTVSAPPHDCPAGMGAGNLGVWTNITPPGIDLSPTAFSGNNFGMQEVVVDPSDPATVFLSTCYQGFFRSTDCGNTWTRMDTGANATAIDGAREWALDIDPVNPQVLYTTAGYGSGNIWQTTNAGVDWQKIIPPGVTDSINAFGGSDGDIYDVKVDPYDHNHIVAVFHSWWSGLAGHNNADAGVLEGRFDATARKWSWTLHNPAQGMGYAQIIFFLDDGNSWLVVGDDPSNGVWRTINEGASFTRVSNSYHQHGGCQLYRSGSTYYACGTPGLLRSIDSGATWAVVGGGVLPYTMGVVGDGTNIYAQQGFAGIFNPPPPPFNSTMFAAEAHGDSGWALYGTQQLSNGGKRMAADRLHHVIYSAAWRNGVWRMVTQ